jgi:hypothetical protein
LRLLAFSAQLTRPSVTLSSNMDFLNEFPIFTNKDITLEYYYISKGSS